MLFLNGLPFSIAWIFSKLRLLGYGAMQIGSESKGYDSGFGVVVKDCVDGIKRRWVAGPGAKVATREASRIEPLLPFLLAVQLDVRSDLSHFFSR